MITLATISTRPVPGQLEASLTAPALLPLVLLPDLPGLLHVLLDLRQGGFGLHVGRLDLDGFVQHEPVPDLIRRGSPM